MQHGALSDGTAFFRFYAQSGCTVWYSRDLAYYNASASGISAGFSDSLSASALSLYITAGNYSSAKYLMVRTI